MQYKGTLIAVEDIAASKRFYHDVLALDIIDDFGANVVLTGGIFLQTAESWKHFIRKSQGDIIFNNNAIELYFEADDMDGFMKNLKRCLKLSISIPCSNTIGGSAQSVSMTPTSILLKSVKIWSW